VVDRAGFAVKKLRGADYFSAKSCADGLVTEANAENGKLSRQALNKLDANSRILRRARPRRDYNAFRSAADDVFDGNFVVAVDFDFAA
jgi:hypothetical protein